MKPWWPNTDIVIGDSSRQKKMFRQLFVAYVKCLMTGPLGSDSTTIRLKDGYVSLKVDSTSISYILNEAFRIVVSMDHPSQIGWLTVESLFCLGKTDSISSTREIYIILKELSSELDYDFILDDADPVVLYRKKDGRLWKIISDYSDNRNNSMSLQFGAGYKEDT